MIRRLKYAFWLGLSVISILISSSVIVPQAASAACKSPSIAFGRWMWCGYFDNKFQDNGDDVRVGGVPGSVNSAQTFINLIEGDLNSGNAHKIAAAQFIIRTMIGAGLNNGRAVSAAQITEFENRLKGYANYSENGTTSTGTNGSIDWNLYWHSPCGMFNSYYQPAWNDIAPYVDDGSNSDCVSGPTYFTYFIVVRDTGGNPVYIIRRLCMNPMGNLSALATPPPTFNYSLTPNINTYINGAGVGSGSIAEVGDTISFKYSVYNNGPTNSRPDMTCIIYAIVHAGSFDAPPPNSAETGSPGPGTGCPRTFPPGVTTYLGGTEGPINVVSGNQTICRSLFVSPTTLGGGTSSVESCVVIANRPYAKVFGGDVAVGGNVETAPSTNSCTKNNYSSITSWNKRTAGNYIGAGTQYGAFALDKIFDFATAQGGGNAVIPTGLAFGNQTTKENVGEYGGDFATATCIPDYYGTKPTVTTPLPSGNVSNLVTNHYSAAGTQTFIGGNVNPNARISVYVDGDVYITGNIIYTGSWNVGSMPLFRLVARGNIYIARGVTQLDGAYIAQTKNASTGTIYTCATSPAPLALDGNLFNNCNAGRLTVNGSLIANRIQLLRTTGSLNQSAPGEGLGGNSAEAINYNPALWIAQPPPTDVTIGEYDAITSLPPVL